MHHKIIACFMGEIIEPNVFSRIFSSLFLIKTALQSFLAVTSGKIMFFFS